MDYGPLSLLFPLLLYLWQDVYSANNALTGTKPRERQKGSERRIVQRNY